MNLFLQDLIKKTKKENKWILYETKCIPEPLEPLMEAVKVTRGLQTDQLAAGLNKINLFSKSEISATKNEHEKSKVNIKSENQH